MYSRLNTVITFRLHCHLFAIKESKSLFPFLCSSIPKLFITSVIISRRILTCDPDSSDLIIHWCIICFDQLCVNLIFCIYIWCKKNPGVSILLIFYQWPYLTSFVTHCRNDICLGLNSKITTYPVS